MVVRQELSGAQNSFHIIGLYLTLREISLQSANILVLAFVRAVGMTCFKLCMMKSQKSSQFLTVSATFRNLHGRVFQDAG